MGSDNEPQEILKGVLEAQKNLRPNDQISILTCSPCDSVLNEILAEQVITMDESPIHAVRRKKKSTLLKGLQLLKEKKVDAFITAGNTGALMLGAYHFLPTLPGIGRPGLLTNVPTEKKTMAVIDSGSNLSCDAEHLIQFATIGIAYQRIALGIEHPRVGLLNVGSESLKGTEVLQAVHKALSADENINFIGNVEGRDAFRGDVDVLVTDGLTGNVFLKTAEGAASFIRNTIQKTFANRDSELLGEISSHLQKQFDYQEYPGATLLGVDGIIVKCHGSCNPNSIALGIAGAAQLARGGLIEQIKQQLK